MAYIETEKLKAALAGDGDLIKLATAALDHSADADLIQSARDQYGSDDIEIDEDAATSEADEGTWVSAWVWVPRPTFYLPAEYVEEQRGGGCTAKVRRFPNGANIVVTADDGGEADEDNWLIVLYRDSDQLHELDRSAHSDTGFPDLWERREAFEARALTVEAADVQ